jgi:regulation of enolase protein 1 (concanavalin A-like superfamily)
MEQESDWDTIAPQAEAEEDQVRRKKSEDAYLVEYEFGLQDIHI